MLGVGHRLGAEHWRSSRSTWARLGSIVVSPLVIIAACASITLIVVGAQGPSLALAVLVGALIAGWSSAWSP